MSVASNNKAAVFRAIAQARRSIKRYQTDREIPAETLKDILQSTIVRFIIEYRCVSCVPVDAMAFQRKNHVDLVLYRDEAFYRYNYLLITIILGCCLTP
jgi:hypothetical protein